MTAREEAIMRAALSDYSEKCRKERRLEGNAWVSNSFEHRAWLDEEVRITLRLLDRFCSGGRVKARRS